MAKYEFDKRHTFINPYNFVPNGGEKIFVSEQTMGEELCTGVLHCRLIAKTPIIIPDAVKRQKTDTQDHYKYPFMKINGKTVIPGSSLRGPIRSMYEALTNSCYSTTTQNQILQGRAKIAFKPGLLYRKNNEWSIYRAIRYCVEKKEVQNWEFAQCVYFEEDSIKSDSRRKFAKNVKQESGNFLKGYLCRGEYIATKKYDSIFVADVNKKGKKRPVRDKNGAELDGSELDAAVVRLKNIITFYENAEENGTREDSGKFKNYRHVKKILFDQEGRYIPVWYNIEGDSLHLSLANIGRFEYEKSLNDVLGSYDSCESRTDRCAACALFGMAKKGNAAVGKVRFTDAELLNDDADRKFVNLSELGTPHITCLPFYLNLVDSKVVGYDSFGASIRGRKFYWHHKPGKNAEGIPNQLNSTMETLAKGATFTFGVYFDGITQTQLKQLLWTLCLGENNIDSPMCYKIGHAKPLGFGSVKIVVNDITKRTLDKNGEYKVTKMKVEDTFFTDIFESSVDKRVYDALRIITNFNSIPEDEEVCYPYVVEGAKPERKLKENVLASHQWFSENYKLGKPEPRNKYGKISKNIKSMELPRAYAFKYENDDYEDAEKSGQKGNRSSDADHRTENNVGRRVVQKDSAHVKIGTVKEMQRQRGTGIIISDTENEEILFDDEGSKKYACIRTGDTVSYTEIDKNGKPYAINVEKQK